MSNYSSENALAMEWLGAIAREDVCAALEAIFAEASSAIAVRGPSCWASGRCCNFEKTGHRLYVTGLEAAYAMVKLPEIAGTRRENFAEPRLRLLVLEDAKHRGGCPFQVGNICGVHRIKPLGCRVYFCDRSAQAWQQDLSECLLARLRAMHDSFGIEYRYGEWREMLGRFAEIDAEP